MLLLASSPRAWAAWDGPVALQVLGSGGPFGTAPDAVLRAQWIRATAVHDEGDLRKGRPRVEHLV